MRRMMMVVMVYGVRKGWLVRNSRSPQRNSSEHM